MSRVTIPKCKDDVELDYHGQTWDRDGFRREVPMLNVKVYAWFDDVCHYADGGHEFSNEPEFWTWLREHDDECDHGGDCMFNRAWEWACESAWELAQDEASGDCGIEFFPGYNVKIHGAGRQGGWLVAEGLPPVRDWDAVMLARWRRYAKVISDIVDDVPYQWVWQLHANWWEPEAERRDAIAAAKAEQAADDAAAQLPVLMGV